jgi:superfamily II DNA/RNA helicase
MVFIVNTAISRSEKVDAHIVVGTPGTVLKLHKKRQLDLSKVKIFVLDEADSMLDQQGLGDESIRIKNSLKAGTQIVLFSATFTEDVRVFAQKVCWERFERSEMKMKCQRQREILKLPKAEERRAKREMKSETAEGRTLMIKARDEMPKAE